MLSFRSLGPHSPMKILLFAFQMTLTSAAISAPVTLDATRGLLRGDAPYFVKGAGGDTELERLAARGANSFRTWSTDGLDMLLDKAESLGLTISAGIWLESECSWFSYANAEHCAKQTERVRQQILKHRDHPALLAWGLGNEAEGDGTNANYWKQMDKLAVMAKEIDPAHPTFTAVAGLSAEKAQGLNLHTPHLDYIGINTYGALFNLRDHLKKVGWTRPWLVTEWGPQGFWERPKTKAGAPLEQTSSEKADMIRRGYEKTIAPSDGCLGSYAFVWGWKYEATVTWFGLLTYDDDTTASVDVLEEMWTGKKPTNRAPDVSPMTGVPKEPIATGVPFSARAEATDPDGDPLQWRWKVLPEKTSHDAGRRPPMPPAVPDCIRSFEGAEASFVAPTKKGLYRVHVWITDGKGHAATANAPLEVQ